MTVADSRARMSNEEWMGWRLVLTFEDEQLAEQAREAARRG